jgi:hypothetical protein
MQQIIAPIKHSQAGAVAANLIECILFLIEKNLLKILDAPNAPTQNEINLLVASAKLESTAQMYGEASQKLVFYFQVQNGLGDQLRGGVDDKTASFLNKILEKYDAFNIEKNYVVTGIITNSKTGAEVVGVVVCAFDADGAVRTSLGQTTTDSKGHYRIEFESSAFRNTKAELGGPDLIIDVFDQSGEVKIGQSKRHNNCAVETVINLAINPPDRCVYGTVTDTGNQPQAKVVVTAWDRDLRKRQLLGDSLTDKQGNYSIAYGREQFAAADVVGQKKPWLIVEVRRTQDGEVLTRAEIKPALVEAKQKVDLQLPHVVKQEQQSEWQRITEVVAPLLQGQGSANADLLPHELTADDLVFITEETGFTRDATQAWVDSSRALQEALALLGNNETERSALLSSVGWQFFYAFFRQQLTGDLVTVLQQQESDWSASWKRAFTTNQVSVLGDSVLSQLTECLIYLRAVLEITTGNSSPVAQIIGATGVDLPRDIALTALPILEQHGTNKPDLLLASLRDAYPDRMEVINPFVRGVRLHQLTDGHLPLIAKLNSNLQDSDHSLMPLARMSQASWLATCNDVGLTASVAVHMQQQVELQHAQLAVQSRLEDKQLSLPASTLKGIGSLLKNNPEQVNSFIVGATRILQQEAEPPHIALKNIGRLMRIGVNMEIATKLMEKGISSPAVIHYTDEEKLREILREIEPELDFFELFARIKEQLDKYIKAGQELVINFNDANRWPVTVGGLNGSYGSPSEKDRIDLPDIPSLFGDLDQCACQPCESMLGQPAYLVDLLELLKSTNTDVSSSLQNELNKRRPDIFELELNCDNADTSIQHIDLVLEILERAIARHKKTNADTKTLTYNKIADEKFPWIMPFDLYWEESAAYFDLLNINRYSLHKLTGENSTILAGVTLNVAPQEWYMLYDEKQLDALWKLYGLLPTAPDGFVDPTSGEPLAGQSAEVILKRISILLERTGLELDSFEELIATDYVGHATIDKRDQCKTSSMSLIVPNGLSQSKVLNRIHRLVRIKQKIPEWSFTELDRAIKACNGLESTNTTSQDREALIVKLATIKRIADNYSVPIKFLTIQPFNTMVSRVLELIGVRPLQAEMLLLITGFNTTVPSWFAFEELLAFYLQLGEIKLSIEDLALAILPNQDTQNTSQFLLDVQKHMQNVDEDNPSLSNKNRAVFLLQQLFPDGFNWSVGNTLITLSNDVVINAIIDAAKAESKESAPAQRSKLDYTLVAKVVTALTTVTPTLNRPFTDWNVLFTSAVDVTRLVDVDTVSGQLDLSEEDRFGLLIAALEPQMQSLRRERALVSAVAELSVISTEDAQAYLSERLPMRGAQSSWIQAHIKLLDETFWKTGTALSDSALIEWSQRLHQLIALSTKMSVSVFKSIAPAIAWHQLLAVGSGLTELRKLLDCVWLCHEQRLSATVVDELFNLPITATLDDFITVVARRMEIDTVTAVNIVTAYVTTSIADLKNPSTLKKVFELLSVAKSLRASSSQIGGLISYGSNNVTVTNTVVELICVRQNLTSEEWQDSDKRNTVENIIRKKRRDALVAYLIQNNVEGVIPRWKNANDVYEYYLIDPLVQPCMKTTRVLEAITATQLFAQRVLFGLEKGLNATPKLKEQWTWVRNYRVWEANRKVFLFPENWLYPELRDDKSSSFKLLESELSKGELNGDLANEAFGKFLDDVAEMGQVQVLGMYEDISLNINGSPALDDNGLPRRRILYVVGRSVNPPFQYYWRKCIDFGSGFMEWSPWQRIELEISGDHVMPFLLNGALCIVWPVISYQESTPSKPAGWNIKLAYSRHSDSAWGKINISRDTIVVPEEAFSDPTWGFALRYVGSQSGDDARIKIFTLKKGTGSIPLSGTLPPATATPHDVQFENPVYARDQSAALIFLKSIVVGNYSHLDEPLKKQIRIFSGIKDQWNTGRGALDGMLKRDLFIADHAYAFMGPNDSINRYNTVRGTYLEIDSLPNPPDWRVESFVGDFFSTTQWKYGVSPNEFLDFAYFNLFFNSIKDKSSLIELTCEAWILLKNSSEMDPVGSSGYLKLNQSSGQFAFTLNGNRIPLMLDSAATPLSWSIGTIQQEACEASITLYNRATGGWVTLKNTQAVATRELGKKITNHLVFRFDARLYNAADIGFDLSGQRELILAPSAFHISSGEEISVVRVSNVESLVSPIQNAQPMLNGYQEYQYQMENVVSIGRAPAIKSVANSQFNLIPANTAPENRVTTIWYFSEAGSSRYLDMDVLSTLNKSGLLVYTNSYRESIVRRVSWQRANTLDQPDIQDCKFELNTDPVVLSSLVTDDWERVKSGELAFNNRLPYAAYNWEVFFHAPLFIADQLSKQHKFEEAERWLRYVFDPTATSDTDDTSFLKFRPFKESNARKQVIGDLRAIAQVAGGYLSETDTSTIDKIIQRWRAMPFRPFVIARERIVAFLWRTLFAYLDNLIAWADSLYRRDTRESNNEAMMLYVMARKIIGRSPKVVAGKSKRQGMKYTDISGRVDNFANYWVDVGARAHKPNYTHANGSASRGMESHYVYFNPLLPTSLGMLLFCMPQNDKIASYWNTIESRLFNLRHCRNIEGTARDLPFTDPPIDPELLVRAVASGLDIGSVIDDLYAPPPHYRYPTLSARANELVGEAKALGSAMLSAMEKRDAEQMAQLRSANEISLLKLTSDIRKLQIDEAEANIVALRATRKSSVARYNQYQKLLGLNGTAPSEGEAVGEVAMLGRFDEGSASKRTGLGLIKEENEQYLGVEGANTWSTAASISKLVGGSAHISASVLAALPYDKLTNAAKVSELVGTSANYIGDAFSLISQGWRTYAEQQGMLAGHLRRRDEWAFQSNQVLNELQQIDKQILANQIRIDITRREFENQLEQIEQSKALDEVLRHKFTNVQLYEWMSSELYSLYDKTYRMALSLAQQSQRAAERELGLKRMKLNIIRNDYWSSQREGLLAAEKLQHDLKRLEAEYLDKNQREFELIKHISLKRLSPEQLVLLRIGQEDDDGNKVNRCEFELPEWLFDLDTAGHYLRRIKSVSLSIPCVVGPYTSVHSRLTLQKSSIRFEPNGILEDVLGTTETVVTSSANADTGMFETQLRDERFLPFEGRGAVSRWLLELPADYPQFDYSTISDVILTVRYTARDSGNDQLRKNALSAIPQIVVPVLFSCRSDFSNAWIKAKADGSDLEISFSKDLLPYWMSNATATSAKKLLLKAGVEPTFETINWSPVDPVPVGAITGYDDALVVFECVLPDD